jgi:hypothetical protein
VNRTQRFLIRYKLSGCHRQGLNIRARIPRPNFRAWSFRAAGGHQHPHCTHHVAACSKPSLDYRLALSQSAESAVAVLPFPGTDRSCFRHGKRYSYTLHTLAGLSMRAVISPPALILPSLHLSIPNSISLQPCCMWCHGLETNIHIDFETRRVIIVDRHCRYGSSQAAERRLLARLGLLVRRRGLSSGIERTQTHCSQRSQQEERSDHNCVRLVLYSPPYCHDTCISQSEPLSSLRPPPTRHGRGHGTEVKYHHWV